ncbi:pyridoxamine 5'-phosphate oxidase family protein [Natronococcus occultus]|uniref:Flavin-nucleotide-binding protein n=1 Tax=Natronococcus occultus SP4 TaxID=694430 RepID=L0JTL2_9EURY|nr:pyridoxamine 5'-phosphate oxidase family protein [Natronococcus occultus]AGB36307.1 hypothetical protein Natoc_0443 [Natronococcus occultus SP4]
MATSELTESETAELLRNANSGVLSLTDGTETYAIPQSFGYDGSSLYFQLVCTADSTKVAFIETTDIATFTVYTERPTKSVIVRGKLDPVPEDEETDAMAVIAENATIPTLNVSPDTPTAELSCRLYRLTPEMVSGRELGTSMRDTMLGLRETCTANLETALRCDDPSEKDYHIRQAMQACPPFPENST